jgi:hypothetical protein
MTEREKQREIEGQLALRAFQRAVDKIYASGDALISSPDNGETAEQREQAVKPAA